MGICLFILGGYYNSFDGVLTCCVVTCAGIGSLIGTPISGALLTSSYPLWIPALFSGIISLAGSMTYIIMQCMFLRRQRVDVLPLDSQAVKLTPE
ncbi:hypothetical protein F4604DRAFT_958121 [Suillus subluteus]|nr:hypothetical protein F4604DRAFT_958121 [Suillus subluteus]